MKKLIRKSLKEMLKTLKKGETLSYLAGINRPVDPAQVSKLAASLDHMGLIRPVVVARISFITGKETAYIIDGQHLFNAMLRNDIPVEYVEVEVKDLTDLVETIALLNASSKSWKLTDYILAWTAVSEDYKKLNKYFNIYDFELSILAAILSSAEVRSNAGGGSITKAIKRGSFKIVDEEIQLSILDDLTDILKVIPRMNRFENRYVCAEYVNFRRTTGCDYDHQKFMKSLENNKQKFILATQEQQKLADMFRNLIK
jgi:hypothetical protein